VVWELGTVKAGSIDELSTRKVFFQISLLPSLSQVGKSFNLIDVVRLSGRDLFTGAMIQRSVTAVSTRLSSDPSFINGQEIISE
jgi:hypothetical protein